MEEAEELRTEWNSTLDYARYFLNKRILKPNLKVSNADTVRRQRVRKFQTVVPEKEKSSTVKWS